MDLKTNLPKMNKVQEREFRAYVGKVMKEGFDIVETMEDGRRAYLLLKRLYGQEHAVGMLEDSLTEIDYAWVKRKEKELGFR